MEEPMEFELVEEDLDEIPAPSIRPAQLETPDTKPLSADPSLYFRGSYHTADVLNVAVVIPFFNEEWCTLQDTLRDLHRQEKFAKTRREYYTFKFHVLIVCDGWKKADSTMQLQLKAMFPHTEPHVWDFVENGDPDVDRTYILENLDENNNAVPLHIVDGSTSFALNVACVIKKNNRKKFNSHQWFFARGGFAGKVNPDFTFATDCATQFKEDCVPKLVNTICEHDDLVAVTGRQRVMTAKMQGSEEFRLSLGSWFRASQCYDFESSFAVHMGCFSLFGFLPVIPGPCGLYRWSMMQNTIPEDVQLNDFAVPDVPEERRNEIWSPLDYYFDYVNRDPSEKGGLVEANLKIAEDRILSMVACFKPKQKVRMVVNSHAVFYFEGETMFESFIFQRRRWINGTAAGYSFLLLTKEGRGWLRYSRYTWITKIVLTLLLSGQLSIYLIAALTPAIFLFSLRFLLTHFTPQFALTCAQVTEEGQTVDKCTVQDGFSMLPNILWGTIFLLYVAFVILHSGREKFHGWLFYMLLLVGAITVGGSFIGSIFFLASGRAEQIETIILCVIYFLMTVPVLLSVVNLRPRETLRMMMAMPGFYLFLPMLAGFFVAYSFARLGDHSWGNRDSGAEQLTDSLEKKFNARAKSIMAFILLANISLVTVMSTYGSGQFSEYFLLAMLVIIFGFTAIQLFLSTIYFSRVLVLDVSGLLFKIIDKIFCLNATSADFHLDLEDETEALLGEV